MRKQGLSFRCPENLLDVTKELSEKTGLSFSDIMIEALWLFVRHVESKGGRISPRYTQSELKKCGKIFTDFTQQIEIKPSPKSAANTNAANTNAGKQQHGSN